MKKTAPRWIRSQFISRLIQSKIGIILSYWLFQGMIYMDIRESLFKISMDIFIVISLCLLGVPLIISFIIAHTLNMLFNGHYYVLMKNIDRGYTGPKKYIEYIENFHNRMDKKNYINGAAAYGSLSRYSFKTSSDFDIRIFPKEGFVNWCKSIFWVFQERLRAFLNKFPLDIYVFDMTVIDNKMRADEPPIIFSDPEKLVAEKYQSHIPFREFLSNFKEKHLHEND